MSIGEVTLGHLRTGWDAGCASAVARVLEAHEVEVAFLDLDRDEREAALASGRVDLIVSAWMPQDAGLLVPGARAIGGLYKPAFVWALVGGPGGRLDSAGSLGAGRVITLPHLEPRVRALLGTPAVGGLDVPVEICADEALYARVRREIAEGGRAIVAVEQPNAVFHDLDLAVLEDRLGVLGGELDARMILGAEAASGLHPDLLDELDEMMLATRIMNALDHAITVEHMDPEDAAEAWQRGRLLPR